MHAGQLEETLLHEFDSRGHGVNLGGIDYKFINFVSDQGVRKLSEILFQGGCNSMDIEVGIRDIEIKWRAFKAFANCLDDGSGTGLAINSFHVHA